jgi:hypothetical protein
MTSISALVGMLKDRRMIGIIFMIEGQIKISSILNSGIYSATGIEDEIGST